MQVRNAEQSGFLSAIIYDNVDEDLLTMASEGTFTVFLLFFPSLSTDLS